MKTLLDFLYIFIPAFTSYMIGWFVGRNSEKRQVKAVRTPKGEWKTHCTGYQGQAVTSICYKCSVCGRTITWVPTTVYPTPELFLAHYPYCHCGADMRGE